MVHLGNLANEYRRPYMLAPHTQPTERNCCPPFTKNKISMRAFHYKSRIKILSHATLNYRTTHPRAPPAPLTAPNCPPPPPRHTYPRHKIPERDRVTSSTCSVPTSSHAASQFLQTSYKPDERPNRYATFVPVWTVIQNLARLTRFWITVHTGTNVAYRLGRSSKPRKIRKIIENHTES